MKSARAVVRAISTSAIRRDGISLKEDIGKSRGIMPADAAYQKRIIRYQVEFSKSPEKLVWQKRARDRGAYAGTLAFGVAGTLLCCKLFWDLMFPKPN